MFIQLKNLQNIAGIIENTANENPVLDVETEYDEYDSEEIMAQPTSEMTPIERKVIVLPSNGNVMTDVSDLEITFRIRQAQSQLDQLRDLIADISFQFHMSYGVKYEKKPELVHKNGSNHFTINSLFMLGYIQGAEIIW